MRSGNFKEDYRQLLALTDSVPVIVWSLVLVAAIALAPLLIGKYFVSLLLLLMVTAVGVLGLNILTGTTGLISLYAGPAEQGRVLGVFRSLGSLTRAFTPILAGLVFWRYGSASVFVAGAVACAAALTLGATLPKPAK